MEVECNEELYMSFWRYFAKTCETMHKTCEMRYILSRSNRKFKTSAIICFKGKIFFWGHLQSFDMNDIIRWHLFVTFLKR